VRMTRAEAVELLEERKARLRKVQACLDNAQSERGRGVLGAWAQGLEHDVDAIAGLIDDIDDLDGWLGGA